MFVGRDLDLLGLHLKGKLLYARGRLLARVKFHCARHFIVVLDFELLDNAVRNLRGDKSAEVEHLFLDVEHVGVYHICGACS